MKLYSYQERALEAIKKHKKGCCYLPTGAGKTVVMMQDAKQRLIEANTPQTFVIVAPRILLSVQLCEEFISYLKRDDLYILHVHSGDTHYSSTTQSDKIEMHSRLARAINKHTIIFTTYNSLERINETELDLDVVYFDEAHHSVKPKNFIGVACTASTSNSSYFFTATPRINDKVQSMNNTDVYGPNIITISAKELLSAGTIIPPEVVAFNTDIVRTKENASEVDAENIIGILNDIDDEFPKVLVAAPSTKIIWEALSHTNLLSELNDLGYTVMHITAKYGCFINRTKVSREKFFEQLTLIGNDNTQKLIVFHYSILSEGIDCPGLTHCILLRNLPTIELLQTIGRVIRVSKEDRTAIQNKQLKVGQFEDYKKSCGKIIVPIHSQVANATCNKLQSVVNAVFVRGLTLST